MGSARKKNSELRWQAAETRQAEADREEHGVFILFDPPAEPEPPEDEPLARDDTAK
jgi:hypothetical protein